MRQKELAHFLGYEPSYVSALERSHKGPPKKDFVSRLIRTLDLTEDEQIELQLALAKSKRQISIPSWAPLEEYELMGELEPQLGRLHPSQIQLIRIALQAPVIFSTARLEEPKM